MLWGLHCLFNIMHDGAVNNKEEVWGKGAACLMPEPAVLVVLMFRMALTVSWVVIDAGRDVYEGLVDAETLE